MDVRRNDPSSPRGRQGRSYHDLAAMRAASSPGSPSAGGADDQFVPLPTDKDDDEPITKLTMRKAKADGEGEGETVSQGLGLHVDEQGREKAD